MGRSLGPHRPASGKLQLRGVAEEKVVSDVHVGEDRAQNFANPDTTPASSRAHLLWIRAASNCNRAAVDTLSGTILRVIASIGAVELYEHRIIDLRPECTLDCAQIGRWQTLPSLTSFEVCVFKICARPNANRRPPEPLTNSYSAGVDFTGSGRPSA
jgi:hypothetical protein